MGVWGGTLVEYLGQVAFIMGCPGRGASLAHSGARVIFSGQEKCAFALGDPSM